MYDHDNIFDVHFSPDKKHYNDKEAISTYFVHALNTVFALVDIWLNAIPFRISSIIFPGIYGLIYGIFT